MDTDRQTPEDSSFAGFARQLACSFLPDPTVPEDMSSLLKAMDNVPPGAIGLGDIP